MAEYNVKSLKAEEFINDAEIPSIIYNTFKKLGFDDVYKRMFENIIGWIKRLFGIDKSVTSDSQQSQNQSYAEEYADISKINFNAIFSKLTIVKVIIKIPIL